MRLQHLGLTIRAFPQSSSSGFLGLLLCDCSNKSWVFTTELYTRWARTNRIESIESRPAQELCDGASFTCDDFIQRLELHTHLGVDRNTLKERHREGDQ